MERQIIELTAKLTPAFPMLMIRLSEIANMQVNDTMVYHPYADDIQLCISTPSELNNAVNFPSLCLEAVWVWMGNSRLWLNPGKIEWLWVLGLSGPGTLPSLVLDEIAAGIQSCGPSVLMTPAQEAHDSHG